MKTIEINLLGDLQPEPSLQLPDLAGRIDGQLIKTLVIAVLIAFVPPALGSVVVDHMTDQANAQLAELQNQISSNRRDASAIEALQQRVAATEQEVQDLQGLLAQGASNPWAPTLEEIRALTPTNLWLTGLSASNGSVSMTGTALDYDAIAYFYANLQHAHNLANPVLGAVTQDSAGQVNFSLTASLPGGT